MKRIFIGIDISETARDAVDQYISGLRRSFPGPRVGWERPDKLHLTLKFLGPVDGQKLGVIADAARAVASSFTTYTVLLSGTGSFPSTGEPRILWIGLKDRGTTAELASRVESECERLGFARESRRFNPHLTIARLRVPRDSRELARYHLSREFGPIEIDLNEITIFESRLDPAGSTYRRIAVYPLSEK